MPKGSHAGDSIPFFFAVPGSQSTGLHIQDRMYEPEPRSDCLKPLPCRDDLGLRRKIEERDESKPGPAVEADAK